jgi:hypothetical protein
LYMMAPNRHHTGVSVQDKAKAKKKHTYIWQCVRKLLEI